MNKESKRVLIVATVVKTHIMQFHVPTLKMFKEMGWETAVAARNDYTNPEDCQIPYCDRFYDIPFERLPFMPQNVKCYKKLKKIIDQGNYQIVHCHTPVGGVLGRLAARKAREEGTRVLYTAHGFHFYRGAPLKNWLMYYPIEKVCSRFADAVLTINDEDYRLAKERFKKTQVFYLPGIGVDAVRFLKAPDSIIDFRNLLNLRKNEKVIISVGEMTANKNHKTIIKALTSSCLENVHYMIVGTGTCRPWLEEYAVKLKVSDRVHFEGYRKDVDALLHTSDVFVFPSYREGLSVALMEAMAAGVPVVASRIRGNVDLIEDGYNGFLCDPEDAEDFANKIQQILDDPALAERFCKNSLEKIKEYDKSVVVQRLREIYCEMDTCVNTAAELWGE